MQPKYPDHIVEVLVKYALDQEPLSWSERQLLEEWRSRSAEHRELPDQLRDPQWREEHRQEISEAPSAEMWENIRQYIKDRENGSPAAVIENPMSNRGNILVAVVLLILGLISFIILIRSFIK